MHLSTAREHNVTLLTNAKICGPPGDLGTLTVGGPALLRDRDLYSAPGWSLDPLCPKEATQSGGLISGRAQNVLTEGTNPDSTSW